MFLSAEKHAEEVLCLWYLTWHGSLILMEEPMRVIYERCCGIAIHKKVIVACFLISTAQGIQKEIRTFSTMLSDLNSLCEWLKAKQCQIYGGVKS
jgi:hypothetical protein